MFEYSKDSKRLGGDPAPFKLRVGGENFFLKEDELDSLEASLLKVRRIHAAHISARRKLTEEELELTGL